MEEIKEEEERSERVKPEEKFMGGGCPTHLACYLCVCVCVCAGWIFQISGSPCSPEPYDSLPSFLFSKEAHFL